MSKLAALEAEVARLHKLVSETVQIPLSDYQKMVDHMGDDDMIVWCEVCGAWLERDDPACATTDDFTGCWKAATGRERDAHLCRSYRATNAMEKKQ